MHTDILTDIESAAHLLQNGEIVAIPTETVYGLAAPIFSIPQIKQIFTIKGRPLDNPLIAHVSSFEQIESITIEIPANFHSLFKAFFPGPLTIILRKQETVPLLATADLPTIGVRMPNHPLTRQLIQKVGPLVAPSANLSGKPSSTEVSHVLEDFKGKLRAILDGGPCIYGLESTVLALEPEPIILRPGSIQKKQIEEVLGQKIKSAPFLSKKPMSPGMKYRHYAPRASVLLFENEIELKKHSDKNPYLKRNIINGMKPEALYTFFRKADLTHTQEICIVLNKETKQNEALMDRLRRASFH